MFIGLATLLTIKCLPIETFEAYIFFTAIKNDKDWAGALV